MRFQLKSCVLILGLILLLGTTTWAANLPYGLKSRLRNLDRNLKKVESILAGKLSAANKIQSSSFRMRIIERDWKFIHRMYRDKYKSDSTYKSVLERTTKVNQQLAKLKTSAAASGTSPAAPLPSALRSRLKSIHQNLDKVDRFLKAGKPKRAKMYWSSAERSYKYIDKYYRNKFPTTHPECKKLAKRMATLGKQLGQNTPIKKPTTRPTPTAKTGSTASGKKLHGSVKYRLKQLNNYLKQAEKHVAQLKVKRAKSSLGQADSKWKEIQSKYGDKFSLHHPEIVATLKRWKKIKSSLQSAGAEASIRQAKQAFSRQMRMVAYVESLIQKHRPAAEKGKLHSMDKRSLASAVDGAKRNLNALMQKYPALKTSQDKEVLANIARVRKMLASYQSLVNASNKVGAQAEQSKKLRHKLSGEWAAKLAPYFDSRTPQYLNLSHLNYIFKNTAATSEGVAKNFKLALACLQQGEKMATAYRAVKFPHGKNNQLKYAEKSFNSQLQRMKQLYADGLKNSLAATDKNFKSSFQYLSGELAKAQKDDKYKPSSYASRRLVETRRYLDHLQVMVGIDKSLATKIGAQLPVLEKRYQRIKQLCRQILKVRGHRDFLLPNRHTAADAAALIQAAHRFLAKDLAKKNPPLKVKILKSHFIQTWRVQQKWVWKDSLKTAKYLRTWRQIRVQIVALPTGALPRFWGGTLQDKNREVGEYKGIELRGNYVYLFQVYMYQDKVGGKWTATKGYHTFTDPLAATNINGKPSATPAKLFEVPKLK